jgi:hypothetical protein
MQRNMKDPMRLTSLTENKTISRKLFRSASRVYGPSKTPIKTS